MPWRRENSLIRGTQAYSSLHCNCTAIEAYTTCAIWKIYFNHSFMRWWLLALPYAIHFFFIDSTSAILIIIIMKRITLFKVTQMMRKNRNSLSLHYLQSLSVWFDCTLHCADGENSQRKCCWRRPKREPDSCTVQGRAPEEDFRIFFVSIFFGRHTFFFVWITNKSRQRKRCGMQIRNFSRKIQYKVNDDATVVLKRITVSFFFIV